MKKSVVIILLIFSIICILGGLMFINTDKDDIKVEVSNSKIVNACIDENNCPPNGVVSYDFISYYSGTEMDEVIENINKDTQKFYLEAKNSKMDDSSCLDVSDIYKNSIQTISEFSHYENKDFLSFEISRTKYNLCTNNSVSSQVESYIYSISSKKILTQEEFKKEINIKNKDINKAIKVTLDELNMSLGTNYSFDQIDMKDTVLFYNSLGELLVSFKCPGKDYYYSAVVWEVVK